MAGGTGNLILKRGTTIPQDGQNSTSPSLLKGMPATQLVGLSHVVDTSGTTGGTLVYAYENYPNRLWVGMDAFGTTGQESGSGSGGGDGPGSFGGGGFTTQETSGAATRPIWFGAEIRADAAVYGDNGGSPPTTDTVPTILQADWANPSDYVLVTQKAIKSYVSSVSSGAVTILDVATAGKTGTLYPMMADGNGSGRNIYIDQTNTPYSYDTTTNTLTITGDLAVNGGDITTTSTGTATIFNTNATALNIGGGVTSGTINLGVGSTGSINIGATGTVRLGTSGTSGGTVEILSGVMTTGGTKTINIGTNTGVGTTSVTIGSTSGTSTVALQGNATITGDLAVNGGDITTTSTGTATLFNANATTVNIGGGATTAVNIGNASGTVTIAGNLTVNGTTTTVNSTTLTVDDKNIELGSVATPNDASTADGGGITLKGTSTDKTIIWNNDTISGITGVWRFSENLSVASGKLFAIADDVVLTKTYWKTYNGGNGGGYVMFKAPSLSTSIGNQEYTLPTAYPDANKVLQSDTSGNLSWVSTGTATDVGVTATDGNTTYNLVLTTASSNTNASLFVDDSDNITYNTSSNRLTVPNLTFTNGIASTITSPNDSTSTLALRGYTTGVSSPVEVLTITNSSNSGGTLVTFNMGSSGAQGTINNTSIGATTRGSGAFTTLTSNAATTFTANTASSSTSTGTLVVTGGVGISGNLYIGGTVGSGTWEATDVGLLHGGTNASLTASAGSVVYSTASAMAFSTVGSSGQLLQSNGTSAPSWVSQSAITAGAVTVRRETTTSNTTKYPIPFLGSTSPSGSNPASSWGSLTADESTQTSYLLTDVTDSGSSSTPTSPTNSSTGLFYEVSDGSSLIGTLYCDYIGATLDCGSY